MKKIIITLFFLLTLGACTNKIESPKMYIQPAKLTETEKNLLELIGFDSKINLYDFKLDGTNKSIQIKTYELIDGEWKPTLTNTTQVFEHTNGRIILSFQLNETSRIAVQSDDGVSSSEFTPAADEESSSSVLTSKLFEQTEFVYDEEIPLFVQVHSNSDTTTSYHLDFDDLASAYAKEDYEHVYAVTVLFSQKEVSELVE